MNDKRLWKVFSEFIRLRDADEQGYCKCFTCGKYYHWRRMDAGHGIGRQHMATKYHEQNNHAQCASCNAFNEGRKDRYKIEMDKRYGSGTWDRLELLSKQKCKWGQFEIDMLTIHYKERVKKLKLLKAA
jgi:hypothetical protein